MHGPVAWAQWAVPPVTHIEYCTGTEENEVHISTGISISPVEDPTLTRERLYLIRIPTARGGNMCEGDDHRVVFIRADRAWASSQFAGCGHIERIAL